MLRRTIQFVAPRKTLFAALRPANILAQQRFYAEAPGAFLEKGQVIERVLSIIKKHEKVDINKVTPTAHFATDLGLDSLDATEVVMDVENEFAIEIPDEEAFKLLSVTDVVNYVCQSPIAK